MLRNRKRRAPFGRPRREVFCLCRALHYWSNMSIESRVKDLEARKGETGSYVVVTDHHEENLKPAPNGTAATRAVMLAPPVMPTAESWAEKYAPATEVAP